MADAHGARGRLHHLAFWVDTREEVLRAADLFLDNDVPIEAAPSKHAVAQGFFLYGFEPGGNRIEVTTGGYFVYDPDPEPTVWTRGRAREGPGLGRQDRRELPHLRHVTAALDDPLRRALSRSARGGCPGRAGRRRVTATSDHIDLKGPGGRACARRWSPGRSSAPASTCGTDAPRQPDRPADGGARRSAGLRRRAGGLATSPGCLHRSGRSRRCSRSRSSAHLLFAFPSGRLRASGTAASSRSATSSQRSGRRSASSSSTPPSPMAARSVRTTRC